MKQYETKEMRIGDEVVKCAEIRPGLLIPEVLLDTPEVELMADRAEAILGQIETAALNTPWIIASTNRDMMGNPRASESHAAGNAFDMSPCWSETELVPESREIMGLAWNLVNCYVLRNVAKAGAVCLEGDHLHVMWRDSKPMAHLLTVPTKASWYSNATLMQDAAKPVWGALFEYHDLTLEPAGKSAQEEFAARFGA